MGNDDTLHILAAIAFGAVGLFLSSLEMPAFDERSSSNGFSIEP